MGVDTLSTAAKHPGILMSRWFRLWNNVLGPGKQRKLPVIVYRLPATRAPLGARRPVRDQGSRLESAESPSHGRHLSKGPFYPTPWESRVMEVGFCRALARVSSTGLTAASLA